ncbi:RNA polymerase sigma factor RpoE [Posidoniimonas polymericola]|uniref:RNA polymerase sigma factor RpoE n=1 Tax=Posidoniimonas polymericola TaxID=2528002 RepID=A0A5C5ZET7_9BACT|nr:sigma-70 family RNA polymerase sigma factor [Posidoniimonas polymericola]TWT85949.1 RNA polymerase sigma factor RpoE [Posidoniimonas polymericola]
MKEDQSGGADGEGSALQTRGLDEELFISLIVRYERRVSAFIKTLLPLDAEVDDLLQEVSVVAWQKFRSFTYKGQSPDEPFVSWLCTIAKFQVLCERKKRASKNVVVPFDDSLVEELATLQLEQASYFEERRQALGECVKKLSPQEREIVRLRFGLGQSIPAIADYLGRKQVTAYQTVARIRVKLSNCVRLTLNREEYS